MGYTSINISYNEGSLCEQISFSEPGEQGYALGSTITLSDERLSRDREMIVMAVNYSEDQDIGTLTTVSGFSLEYLYARKAPAFDISFLTMTQDDHENYLKRSPKPDSILKIRYGDEYGSNGWTMHSIINEICRLMGISAENTLPNYYISDFTVSLGSTYFEAITSLVSIFSPIITLSRKVLYIVDRGSVGILPWGNCRLTNVTLKEKEHIEDEDEQLPSSGIISSIILNREYAPIPGCVKVEGQEGKYIGSKDISAVNFTPTKGSISTSEGVSNDDGTIAYYKNALDFYKDPYNNQWATFLREEECRIYDRYGWFLSATKNTTEMEYNPETLQFKYANPVLDKESKTCEAWVGNRYTGGLRVYNKIENSYTYDEEDWSLKSQLSTKQELFIYDGDTYTKYDPRDYDPEEDGTTLELVQTEQRSTIYTYLTEESYSVDTQISSQVYNEEDEEWQTIYTFEHDVVLAGGQQHVGGSSGISSLRTLQVYDGDCPIFPTYSSFNEPAQVFNISTPDWNSIYSCYIAIKTMLGYEYQTATVETLATNWYWNENKEEYDKTKFDPLPFMSMTGFEPIMTEGIKGSYFITGYNTNIDPTKGYTVSLNLEVRLE